MGLPVLIGIVHHMNNAHDSIRVHYFHAMFLILLYKISFILNDTSPARLCNVVTQEPTCKFFF